MLLIPALFHRPFIRRSIKLGLDTLLALVAWGISTRLFAAGSPLTLRGTLLWMALSLLVAATLQLARQHYRLVGFRDARRLGLATLILCFVGAALSLFAPRLEIHHFEADVAVGAALITGVAWMTLRGAFRVLDEDRARVPLPLTTSGPKRTLIIGAGRAGLLTAQELTRHPGLGGQIAGFVDDAMEKQGLQIQGIPVLGTTMLLPRIIKEQSVDQVVIAIPSESGDFMRSLTEQLHKLPVRVKTVPGIFDLLGNRSWKPVLQDVSIEDLLRRKPVTLDQHALKEVLEEQVVLITGAGGSIGGELTHQVAQFKPARIVLLGRGENSLWETERSLRDAFPNQSITLALCDIRNEERLNQVFDHWKPTVVLHAAAHKHVPYLEAHPAEAVDNNVFGTRNVLEACLRTGVGAFVNISTDKAVNPTNVLGATKRLAECLVLDAAARSPEGGHYASVRFGNVLGSRGSVVPIFRQQIQAGGPLTVTHPDMTRYFMTIPEASQLVLQAGLLGETGRVYVLDMGEPVRILDLAKDMIRLSGLEEGQEMEIEFTGLRPGEKLFEELFTGQETHQSSVHSKVFDGEPEPVDSTALREGLASLAKASSLPEGERQREHLALLKRLVPTYRPSKNGLGRYEATNSGGVHAFRLLKTGNKAI